jgi:hypothetical protein
MFKLALAFGLGWYFGRTPAAGQRVVMAGRQLLDAVSREPIATNVLPDTRVVSPEQAAGCPPGYTWWPQYGQCLDPSSDARLREQWLATHGQTQQ